MVRFDCTSKAPAPRYMKVVETFSRLMELCHGISLAEEDVL